MNGKAQTFGTRLGGEALRALPVARKGALEEEIAERHRQSRTKGEHADVRGLSSALRETKRGLAELCGITGKV